MTNSDDPESGDEFTLPPGVNRLDPDEARAWMNLAQAAQFQANYQDCLRTVAAMAANCLDSGQPLPESLRNYLTDALRKVADGQRPDKAFGFVPPVGGNIWRNLDRDLEIHALVSKLHDAGTPLVYLGNDEDKAQESAFAIVASQFHLSAKEIGTIYYRIKKLSRGS